MCAGVGTMGGVSAGYASAYRLGFTPWKRYRRAAAASNAPCFRMLASVFGFKVALGLPATVTSPGLVGCSKVSVRAAGPPECPPVSLQQLDHFSTFIGMA